MTDGKTKTKKVDADGPLSVGPPTDYRADLDFELFCGLMMKSQTRQRRLV
jgi:hypothetical protein